MSLMLEEFYAHLSVVGVSSKVGTGMEEFFTAVEEKKQEFLQDYLPELERRRKEREEGKMKARDKELGKMMADMAVSGSSKPLERKATTDADGDDDIDVPSDESSGDEDSDEEREKESLQERYQNAMGEGDDSVMADASFAKYLAANR